MDRHEFKAVDKHLTWLLRHWVAEEEVIRHRASISKKIDKRTLDAWRQDGRRSERVLSKMVLGGSSDGKVFFKAIQGHSKGKMRDDEAFDKVSSADVHDAMYFVTRDTRWASISTL